MDGGEDEVMVSISGCIYSLLSGGECPTSEEPELECGLDIEFSARHKSDDSDVEWIPSE